MDQDLTREFYDFFFVNGQPIYGKKPAIEDGLRKMMDEKVIHALSRRPGTPPKWEIIVSNCNNPKVVASATKRLNELGIPERFYIITDMKTAFGGELCIIDQ
jgi:hypothetical protein